MLIVPAAAEDELRHQPTWILDALAESARRLDVRAADGEVRAFVSPASLGSDLGGQARESEFVAVGNASLDTAWNI